jgi:hypothetical protein
LKKYGRAVQATDGNIIWRMCIACWVNKATNTQFEIELLIVFPLQQKAKKRGNVTLYVHCLSCLLQKGLKVSNKLASMEE